VLAANAIAEFEGNIRTVGMAGLAAIVLAGAWIWPLPPMAHDLFAAHMFQHLLAMNLAAPLIATALRREAMPLSAVAILQLAALWIWHAPAVFIAAHDSVVLQTLMQVSLFGAALLFWMAILDSRTHPVWHRICTLLASAKIFCLLGATFVFSRRTLYVTHGNPENWGLTALEDQQLAGLLMVSSCALIYVAAAIALFARWLFTIGHHAAFAGK